MNKKLASLVIVMMLVFTAFAGVSVVSAQSVDTGTDNGKILNGSSNLNAATDTDRTTDTNGVLNSTSTTENTINTTNTTNLNSTTTGGTVQNAPGVPATGMGGDTVLNLTILVLSAVVLLGGVAYMSRASVR